MATKRTASVCLRTAVTLVLLALVSPLMRAQVQLSYFKNYLVTGDYVAAGVSLANVKPTVSLSGTPPTQTLTVADSINFSGVPCTSGPGLFASVIPCSATGAVPADVIAAFLYWQTIENTAPCTPVQCGSSGNGSFDGSANTFSGVELGNPTVAACAARGGTQANEYARVYRADVLRFLPINNTANVRVANGTQTFTLTSSSANTQFVGATLVVVYRLVTPGNPRIAPLRSVVIYDGSFTGTPAAGLNQTIFGPIQAAKNQNPPAKMTHMVGNGEEGFKETLTVNGSIPSGQSGTPIDGDQGPGWDVDTFNYNLAANASSVQTKVILNSDCLTWAAIITSVNVQDSDFDGIPDIAEEYGLYFDPGVRYDGVVPLASPAPTPATFGTCQQYPNSCLNLPAMGAKPFVPDIFVQVDWMYDSISTPNTDGNPPNPPHSHNPQFAALKMVGDVFKAHGINLHFDVGNDSSPYCQAANGTFPVQCNYQSQNSPYIIPGAYAHGGNAVNESNYPNNPLLCPNLVTQAQNCAFPLQSNLYSVLGWKFGFDAIRDGDPSLLLPQLFPQDEKDTVHYALFGHALAATTPLSMGEAGSVSGVADHPGGDILVTLGLWRSGVPAVDQVGTVLQQAGTLMHELGHNLDLSHAGWHDTPNCMPNYASVMNYLYQVAGLTDSAGNEHLDYSYGLLLPLLENDLSLKIPMGIQLYRVRYFGPLNSIPNSPLANSPNQASKAYCTTGYPSEPGQSYVRLEWPSISTPDWSNGTVPSGTKLLPLDINDDGTTTGNNPGIITNETFFDSPDWISINLQQVSARAGADGFSSNLGLSQIGLSQIGLSQIGLSQIGLSQIGLSQIGLSQIGLSQIGISDAGTSALGQDALGDPDLDSVLLSGGAAAPTGLTANATPQPPSSPTIPPYAGATGILFTWTPSTSGVASGYNIYACNATAGACTPAGTPIASPGPGSSYTVPVNDFTHAGTTCPTGSICYNTPYNFYIGEVETVAGQTIETCSPTTTGCAANIASSEVYQAFIAANPQPTVTYGATALPFPAPTYTQYPPNSSAFPYTVPTSGPNSVSCAYSSPPRNAGTYTISCSGPPAIPGSAVGVTYLTPPMLSLNYPASLGGPVTQGSLTINQASLTIMAAAETKTYDGTPSAPLTNPPAITGLQTQAGYGDTVTGLAETYNTANAGSGLTLSVSAYTIIDGNGGSNYITPTAPTTLVSSTPRGVISKANTTTTITSVPSPAGIPGVPATVTVTVAPTTTVAAGAGPTQTVAVGSTPAALACPVTLSDSALNSSATGGCMLTFPLTAPPTPSESITATYGGDTNFVGSAAATVLPLLTSITVAPTANTSYTGDTVWVNYDWPGQGSVLAPGGSALVTAVGTTFNVADGGISVKVTGTNITVTFNNAWDVNTTPVSFDGLVITDPLVSIASVTPVSNSTGATTQLSFDGNDVYINFLSTSTIPAGTSVSVNVQFAASPLSSPYGLPAGGTEQFTATGNYTSGITPLSIALTGVTWSSMSPSVTIDPVTGIATGVATGSSTISAGYGPLLSGLTGSTTVTVPALVSIAVTPALPYISGTNMLQFTATGTYSDSSTQPLTNLVTWNSSATGVATISAAGQATGGVPGTTTISAALGGVTGTMLLTVNPAAPASPTPVTATITAANKPYDGTTLATITSCTLANVAPADVGNVTCIASGATFASASVGAGQVTATVSLAGPVAGNYVLSSNTATIAANIEPSIDFTTLVPNGSAAPVALLSGTALQLTNDMGGETSSAWLTNEQPVASGFSTSFDFQITPAWEGANTIADGFAFVIQAQSGTTPPNGTATLGTIGLGMYIGYAGIPNSIAIEFDTYQNAGPAPDGYDDPVGAHIAIQSRGKQPNSPDHNTATGANLGGGPVQVAFADGDVHNATITYDGVGTLSVFVDGNFVVSAPVNLSMLLFLDSGGTNAFLGFTSATGGLEENSYILGWSIN